MADTRHVTLDAVRGVAVMGILLMNIAAFAMPDAAYFNPLAYGHQEPADIWAWAVMFVLFDGKMRGLFSLLFGASMLLVVERAEAAGGSGAAVHYRRMGWLLLFGIAHLYLIWWGDILVHYALIGMIAFAFVGASTRTLTCLGVAGFAAAALLMAMPLLDFIALRHAAALPGASAATIAGWQGFVDEFGIPSPTHVTHILAVYRDGTWPDIVRERFSAHGWDPLWYVMIGGAETLALMLFGMAGLKSGFLTGAWERRRYARWAITAYAVGLPLAAALAWASWSSGFDPIAVFATSLAAQTPIRPVIMIGHASALLWLFTSTRGWLFDRVAAAGRMAFSNYLGTSLLMTTLFYGYGFGQFGEVRRALLYPIVGAVWLLMLAWSKPWLDRFAYGPFEWLWRALARGELPPLRRKEPVATKSQ